MKLQAERSGLKPALQEAYRASRRSLSILLSLVLSARIAISAQPSLPPIQMPEYVISGVEKATLTTGDRIPSRISAVESIPEMASQPRPEFGIPAGMTGPESPVVLRPFARGGLRAKATLGLPTSGSLDGLFVRESFPDGNYLRLDGEFGPFRSFRTLDHEISPVGDVQRWELTGGLTREIGAETTIQPEADFRTRTLNRLFYQAADYNTRTRRLSDLSLSLAMTPVRTGYGVLTGRFQFAYSSLSGDGSRNASYDQLRLGWQRYVGSGILEASLDGQAEAVSGDAQGHTFYALSSSYQWMVRSDVLLKIGLIGYGGHTSQWDSTTTADWSKTSFTLFTNTGWGEDRFGAAPSIKVMWQPGWGGIAEAGYAPQASFFAYRDVLDTWGVVDTLSRGTTIQEKSHYHLGYSRRIVEGVRGRVRVEYSESLHYPYLLALGSSAESPLNVVTRGRTSLSAELLITADLPAGIGAEASIRLNRERTSGQLPGDNATFTPSREFALDLTIPVGEHYLLAEQFNRQSGVSSAFEANSEYRSANWLSSSVVWTGLRPWTVSVGIDNLLETYRIDAHGYTDSPRVFWCRAEWRGDPFLNINQ